MTEIFKLPEKEKISPKSIQDLEQFLTLVKQNKIESFIIIARDVENNTIWTLSEFSDRWELIGAIECMKAAISESK